MAGRRYLHGLHQPGLRHVHVQRQHLARRQIAEAGGRQAGLSRQLACMASAGVTCLRTHKHATLARLECTSRVAAPAGTAEMPVLCAGSLPQDTGGSGKEAMRGPLACGHWLLQYIAHRRYAITGEKCPCALQAACLHLAGRQKRAASSGRSSSAAGRTPLWQGSGAPARLHALTDTNLTHPS